MIGDFLYELTPRDLQVTPLELDFQEQVLNQAAATIQPSFVVPQGRVLILRSALAEALGGGGQTVSVIQIHFLRQNSTQAFKIISDLIVAGAPASAELAWSGLVLIPPGASVVALCQYSAGVAVNTARLYTTGILIPRGNLAI